MSSRSMLQRPARSQAISWEVHLITSSRSMLQIFGRKVRLSVEKVTLPWAQEACCKGPRAVRLAVQKFTLSRAQEACCNFSAVKCLTAEKRRRPANKKKTCAPTLPNILRLFLFRLSPFPIKAFSAHLTEKKSHDRHSGTGLNLLKGRSGNPMNIPMNS